MIGQKQPKIKTIQKKDYTKSGKPLTELEFNSMVKESEQSGYMTLDEFKKSCRTLLTKK
jgi:hypothetical protein